jgi:hypothetical protein
VSPLDTPPLDYTDAFIWLDDLVAACPSGSHDELCGLAALDALRRVLPLRDELASARNLASKAEAERDEARRILREEFDYMPAGGWS